MTPHPAAARLTLDPATTDETLATIFAALRLDPDRTPAQHQTQREAAAALIAALHPRDPTEAAVAARAVAAHYGSMECFRRAALPDTPDNVADRLYGKALALSRMNTDMVRTLRQCQAETPHAQPQPAAEPTMPAPSPSAAAPPPAASIPENPAGRHDPTPSERPSPARPAAPASQPETAAAAQRPATAAPTPPATSAQPSQAGLATEHPPAQPAARTASTATALAA
jgi:hypothetical protein